MKTLIIVIIILLSVLTTPLSIKKALDNRAKAEQKENADNDRKI